MGGNRGTPPMIIGEKFEPRYPTMIPEKLPQRLMCVCVTQDRVVGETEVKTEGIEKMVEEESEGIQEVDEVITGYCINAL